MDKIAEFEAESFRLPTGKFAFALTHIPSGLRVEDDLDADGSIQERWVILRKRLNEVLKSQNVDL